MLPAQARHGSTSKSPKVGVVNGLRGLAICGVLWEHTVAQRFPPTSRLLNVAGLRLPLLSPLGAGWLGVNLFFVLSGFVLMLPYAREERAFAAADFYRRRARRLLPLYYSALFVGLFVFGRLRLQSKLLWLGVTSTFLFNFTPRTFYPEPSGVFWSLGIEVWLSLTFPLLIALWGRFGPHRVLVGACMVGLLVRVVGVHVHAADVGDAWGFNVIRDSFAGRIDEFVVGMFVADRYARRDHARSGRALFAGGVIFLAGTWLWDWTLAGTIAMKWSAFYNDVVDLGIGLLLWGSLTTRSRAVRRFLENWPLQITGAMCYSLYVWHPYVITRVHGPALLLVLFLVAAMSYRFIEFRHEPHWRALFAKARA